jgi:hypothetical protein
MSITTALPAAVPFGRAWIIALFFGLLSLTAVKEMRTDCHDSSQYLTDDYGAFITNAFGVPIALESKRQCQLVVSDIRVRWLVWGN